MFVRRIATRIAYGCVKLPPPNSQLLSTAVGGLNNQVQLKSAIKQRPKAKAKLKLAPLETKSVPKLKTAIRRPLLRRTVKKKSLASLKTGGTKVSKFQKEKKTTGWRPKAPLKSAKSTGEQQNKSESVGRTINYRLDSTIDKKDKLKRGNFYSIIEADGTSSIYSSWMKCQQKLNTIKHWKMRKLKSLQYAEDFIAKVLATRGLVVNSPISKDPKLQQFDIFCYEVVSIQGKKYVYVFSNNSPIQRYSAFVVSESEKLTLTDLQLVSLKKATDLILQILTKVNLHRGDSLPVIRVLTKSDLWSSKISKGLSERDIVQSKFPRITLQLAENIQKIKAFYSSDEIQDRFGQPINFNVSYTSKIVTHFDKHSQTLKESIYDVKNVVNITSKDTSKPDLNETGKLYHDSNAKSTGASDQSKELTLSLVDRMIKSSQVQKVFSFGYCNANHDRLGVGVYYGVNESKNIKKLINRDDTNGCDIQLTALKYTLKGILSELNRFRAGEIIFIPKYEVYSILKEMIRRFEKTNDHNISQEDYIELHGLQDNEECLKSLTEELDLYWKYNLIKEFYKTNSRVFQNHQFKIKYHEFSHSNIGYEAVELARLGANVSHLLKVEQYERNPITDHISKEDFNQNVHNELVKPLELKNQIKNQIKREVKKEILSGDIVNSTNINDPLVILSNKIKEKVLDQFRKDTKDEFKNKFRNEFIPDLRQIMRNMVEMEVQKLKTGDKPGGGDNLLSNRLANLSKKKINNEDNTSEFNELNEAIEALNRNNEKIMDLISKNNEIAVRINQLRSKTKNL